MQDEAFTTLAVNQLDLVERTLFTPAKQLREVLPTVEIHKERRERGVPPDRILGWLQELPVHPDVVLQEGLLQALL